MANHQYGVQCDDAVKISLATVEARAELHRLIGGLRSLGGVWENVRIVATGAQLGVREGRRLHGRATLTLQNLIDGARFPDSVCRATFCVDIHSTNPARDGKGLHGANAKTLPYDIPAGALISRDISNLMMAGRCISGDFFAHGSYRVTGNAVAMGEAAGWIAARAAVLAVLPQDVAFTPNSLLEKA
ncbi:MAG: FAD-dependent oxidoreductase [Spirochaetia bacterium]|nr:FAD-dependent oxidoreductase [Spirochaetia bacterium]